MVIRTNGNGQKPHAILLYPKTGLDLGSTVAPPHALLTVAAPMLKAGYSVKLLDQRVEPIIEEVLRPLISSDLLAVGISTMTGTQVYFTHSYAAPVTADCVAASTHAEPFAAAVERDCVFGVQFHPEKSGDTGLHILRNFLELT